jgi:hypothetical protein
VLREIEDQLLWPSTAIIHHANHVRPSSSALRVGGHQASSASIVSIMTTLWFRHLRAEDRVKPHASPVLHATNSVPDRLDESYLPRLHEFGGLQRYPSRIKAIAQAHPRGHHHEPGRRRAIGSRADSTCSSTKPNRNGVETSSSTPAFPGSNGDACTPDPVTGASMGFL